MKSIRQFLDEVGYSKDLTKGHLPLFPSTEQIEEQKQIINNTNYLAMDEKSFEVAEMYAKELHARKIDITEAYRDWIRIAYAFVNSYGEAGRKLFHIVSKAGYRNYNKSETDRLYTDCIARKRKPGQVMVMVATFIMLAKNAGIDFSEKSITSAPDEGYEFGEGKHF